MNYHRISVIIPTRNNGAELRRAVKSVLNQQVLLSNTIWIEIIIINDASDEAYEAPLQQLIEDYPPCTLIHLDQQAGPARARNAGISIAQGDLISFLDADDEWPADKLTLLLPLLDSYEVVGGKVKYLHDEGADPALMQFEDDENRITHVHLGALIAKKEVFEKGLYFDQTLTFSEDIDWWFRLREQAIPILLIEATTLLYHVHGENMSVNKNLKELQLLKVFHRSVRRRKEGKHHYLPQITDFRREQADPLISIVIPLYNGKKFISKTIDSVLRQTYLNWELIVVDDGSQDEGGKWVQKNYPMVTLITQKNAGVAAARNTGIRQAKGNLLAFLDQDDEWVPTKLREQWEALKQDPYCVFVTCNELYICEEGYTLPASYGKKIFTEEHRSFVPSALLIRKQALFDVQLFDETLIVGSDTDLIRKLRRAGCKEANVDKLLLKKWFHGANASLEGAVVKKELLALLHKQIKGK